MPFSTAQPPHSRVFLRKYHILWKRSLFPFLCLSLFCSYQKKINYVKWYLNYVDHKHKLWGMLAHLGTKLLLDVPLDNVDLLTVLDEDKGRHHFDIVAGHYVLLN